MSNENTVKTLTDLLLKLNVNDYTEKKNGLTYLSWAWAWQKTLELDPNANYVIKKNEFGLPYFGTSSMGYMVYTEVTFNGVTREMWLPVMDGANKSLKDEAYEYSTRYGNKSVEAINMFDVNKTVMRCLVKNLAMFGLGLYIYAGEDLPDDDLAEDSKKQDKKAPTQSSNNTKKPPTQNKPSPPKKDELSAKIAEIDALARKKVEIDKDAVIKSVSENNNNDPNYKNVKTVEDADKIIKALTNIK